MHKEFDGFGERKHARPRFVSRAVGTIRPAVTLLDRLHPGEHVAFCVHQLQPLVEPQLGQAWQEPARIICTPHCMHMGESL